MHFRRRILLTLFFREAVLALFRNRARSLLSALGIVIGVAAVVLVVAVGQSGSERVEAQLQALGDNLVWIEAGSRNVNGVRSGTHGMNTLMIDDALAIARELPLINRVSPQIDGTVLIIGDGQNWTTRFRGDMLAYFQIKKWAVSEGTAFSDEDVEQSASKILLGETVAEKLFGSQHAVGRLVRMQNQVYEVVGILAAKGQSADGRDQDDWILLP